MHCFRVDANEYLGIGHITRCKSLALDLLKKKISIIFVSHITSQNFIENHIKGLCPIYYLKKTRSLVNLQSHHKHDTLSPKIKALQENDAHETLSIISKYNIDWLVIDNYGISGVWEKYFYNKYKLFIIDDLANQPHKCDLLLNQSLQLETNIYENLLSKKVKVRLGPKHVLLSDEYKKFNLNKRKIQKIKNVLIYVGSGENKALILKIIKFSKVFRKLNFTVLVNHKNSRFNYIKALGRQFNIKILFSVKNMYSTLLKNDITLGVCGMSAWERCATGQPSISFITAKNQEIDARMLHKKNGTINLGPSEKVTVSKIRKVFSKILKNKKRLDYISYNALQITKGWVDNKNELISILSNE